MPRISDTLLPVHPLVAVADVARFHEAEYADKVGRSYGAGDAHNNIRAAALLMAFFDVFKDMPVNDEDLAAFQSKHTEYLAALALTYSKGEAQSDE